MADDKTHSEEENYIQEPIPGILCKTCALKLNIIAQTKLKDRKTKFMFFQLLLATLLKKARDKVQKPEWVQPNHENIYVELELAKDTFYNGPFCRQYIETDVIKQSLEWAINPASCPYKITEASDGVTIIEVTHKEEKVQEPKIPPKDTLH